MLERMIGAARLNVHTFEDVENDEKATTQAMLVVVMMSIAGGIGGLGAGGAGGNIIVGLIAGIVYSLASWALAALITFWVGTTLLRTPQTHASWSQLARTIGFAQTPLIFQVFGFIPNIGIFIVVAANIWRFAAMVIAVRQALDYQSTLRAVGVVAIWLIVVLALLAIVVSLFPGPLGIPTGSPE
jgi:hypothetical protein